MNTVKLAIAVQEARRFLDKAGAYTRESVGKETWQTPKQSGAVRRASMDLTRALADLRRPG